jgi:hypothetical protein
VAGTKGELKFKTPKYLARQHGLLLPAKLCRKNLEPPWEKKITGKIISDLFSENPNPHHCSMPSSNLNQASADPQLFTNAVAGSNPTSDSDPLDSFGLGQRLLELARSLDEPADQHPPALGPAHSREHSMDVTAANWMGVLNGMERQFQEFLRRLETRFNASHPSTATGPNEPVIRTDQTRASLGNSRQEAASESSISWESQKQRILSELEGAEAYSEAAICGETGASQENPDGGVALADSRQVIATPTPTAKTGIDAIYASLAQLESVKIDSEIIEGLKEQLTCKLREAEIEISISRAKLSQEWAILQQQQDDLRQREADWLAKSQTETQSADRGGMLDRLTRHLSRKAPGNR